MRFYDRSRNILVPNVTGSAVEAVDRCSPYMSHASTAIYKTPFFTGSSWGCVPKQHLLDPSGTRIVLIVFSDEPRASGASQGDIWPIPEPLLLQQMQSDLAYVWGPLDSTNPALASSHRCRMADDETSVSLPPPGPRGKENPHV